MTRSDLSDLAVFAAVARARSFTRAAAQLRVTQPALSATVRGLEARLGVPLLLRGPRGVTLTAAGERLLARVAPELDDIVSSIDALSELRDEANGTIRITAIDYAIRSTLWPKLARFLPAYPGIKVELCSEYESLDIVARGYDAGVRFGEELARDMVSVRIGPDIRNTVVASPTYFSQHAVPTSPHSLSEHQCINLRTSTLGGLYEWEFTRGGQTLDARVEGSVIFNNAYDILAAAKDGFGLAYLPEDMVSASIAAGELVSVLEPWCPVWPGLHLYYPNRRHPSRAMSLVIDALRYHV